MKFGPPTIIEIYDQNGWREIRFKFRSDAEEENKNQKPGRYHARFKQEGEAYGTAWTRHNTGAHEQGQRDYR